MGYIVNEDSMKAATEWFLEATATLSPNSEFGEAAEQFAVASKAGEVVLMNHQALTNLNYPEDVRAAVAKLQWLALLGGHDPEDVTQTFANAWNTIVTVPDNLVTGMTKDEFYADLEAKFPDLFVSDGSGGLIKPTLIDYPGSPEPFNMDVPHTPPAVPAAISAAKTPWNAAFTESSPLVLDLTATHTGVALTTFNAATTSTFFDIDNSGFATQTAWVGANMGLLCRDLNDNGRIDNAGELFGSSTVDGFALLSTLDSNGDHRIDQWDSAWSTLKIWVDDGDAVTQVGELYSLSDLGIASIDLAAVAASTSTISGNPISHTSFFTFTNGATATVADAWFVHDKVDSYYNGDYTLDVDTLFLPTLRGFGTLPDLAITESMDSTLKGLVSDFASGFDPATAFADSGSLNDAIKEMLFQWAGVGSVDPDSRGGYFDAQQLEFLEKFFGQSYIEQSLHSPNPQWNASDDLQDSWNIVFPELKAALLTQAGADAIFAATASYNPSTGTFEGAKTLSQDAIDALQAAVPTGGTAAIQSYWDQVAQYIDQVKGLTNLTTGENTMMNSAIVATDASLSWITIKASAYSDLMNGGGTDDTIYGTSGADNIYGGDGNDTLHGLAGGDILHGGSGNDTLYGDEGDDILDPGTGGNFVYGGTGNDTYVFGGGTDVYSEVGASGSDTILMPSGVSSGDLSFARTINGGDNLFITVGSLGTIEIKNFFAPDTGHTTNSIESITFADTTTLGLSSLTSLTTYGTDGADAIQGAYTTADLNDTVFGYGGNDVITTRGGDDYLDGGAGNDVLKGGSGNDTYAASPGFDTIQDDSGSLDTILMPAGITADDIHLLRHSNAATTLEITIDGLGQINVLNQFNGSGIEQIELADNSTIDLTTHVIETVGTSGNDTINGILAGASTNDVIDGREGNDAMYGGSGNDMYIFSVGTDTISDTAGTDVLSFGAAWTPGDISVYRDAGTNLVFSDGNGNSTTILSQYYNSLYSVESAHFSDNTTWNLLTMQIETHGTSGADNISAVSVGNQNEIIYGYGGNDSIHGGTGNNVLYGGDGNDFLYGNSGSDILDGGAGNDTLYGANGDDTYVFSAGSDIIVDDTGGIDTLAVHGSINFEDLALTTSGYNLIVTQSSTGDNMTILDYFWGSGTYRVETLTFDDGFHIDLGSYSGWHSVSGTYNAGNGGETDIGSSGADTITGGSGDDVIVGMVGNDNIHGGDGNDQIRGGDGNDTLYGGNGADTLWGGNGADTLYGDAGNDLLYGGDGADTITGGTGADTFAFQSTTAFSASDTITDFTASDGDKIDIRDLLVGYDPLTSLITDFVHVTASGSNAVLSVDANGTTGGASFTQIATLTGMSSLAGHELDLLANGNLIAHAA